MSMDLEEQYDKIYRYCYYRLHQREAAEDVTQETFLRFLENEGYRDRGRALQYLYTIARNLCIDEYRKRKITEELHDDWADVDLEEKLLTAIALKKALSLLTEEERELLLLRYVNEVPVMSICKIFKMSRFAVYRKTTKALKQLQELLEKEEFL